MLVLAPGREHWLQACTALLEEAPRRGRIVLAGSRAWATATRALITDTKRLRIEVLEQPIDQNFDRAFVQMCMSRQDAADTL